jgi:surfeit locus 1 family protein
VQFRKPTGLTVILGLVCLTILLGLGFWQLDRRDWKQNLVATIAHRLETVAEPLPASLDADWTYRRVSVAGAVVPNSWFRFPGHSKDGKVGDVLMLLIREDSGRLVLVENAFVGFGEPLPALPTAVAKEGILRLPAEPGWFTPANDPAANQWYTADPAAMAVAAGAGQGPVLPFYVVNKDWQPHLPNNHLQYALTWFSFAFIFSVIFILFHRKRPKKAAA